MIRAHSDVLILMHIVFSTVDRRRLIRPERDVALTSMFHEAASAVRSELLGVGIADDHVHLVASIHPSVPVADVAQRVKGVSSRMWNLTHPQPRLRWQEGYWARSVDIGSLPRVLAYLQSQRQRHATKFLDLELEQTPATEPIES
jgi:putative transposase